MIIDVFISNNMIKLLKNKWIITLAGAIAGLLYWKFTGCTSDACAIQQNWQLSTLWGASLGWLLSGICSGNCCGSKNCSIPSNNKEKTPENNNNNNNNQEE